MVTQSILRCNFSKAFSSTTVAKIEVPADTLPVLAATELVATIPVPASPSGGQSGQPATRVPVVSRSFALLAVKVPALAPATRTLGRRSSRV